MQSRDISLVMQGAIPDEHVELSAIVANIRTARERFPDAQIIVSSWEGSRFPSGIPADVIVKSPDPGSLGYFSYRNPTVLNNVNRQVASTCAGIGAVDRPYTLKMRLDIEIQGTAFLDVFERHARTGGRDGRIVVPHLFTVNPRIFEHMPFHFSDWFQFGRSDKMRALWRAPFMSQEDACYYDSHIHAHGSSRFDRCYRSRFAAEQHVWVHYARSLGYVSPDFHNDIRPAVLAAHDDFVVNETVIVDTAASGLVNRKYAWALRSGLQRFNCLSSHDWHALVENARQRPVDSHALNGGLSRRQRAAQMLAGLARRSEPIAPLLMAWPAKPALSGFLKAMDRWSSSSRDVS